MYLKLKLPIVYVASGLLCILQHIYTGYGELLTINVQNQVKYRKIQHKTRTKQKLIIPCSKIAYIHMHKACKLYYLHVIHMKN